MIIIFYGEQHYFKKDVMREAGQCSFCGRNAYLETFTARKMGYLYFVPLLPIAHERVIRMCPCCKRYRVIPAKTLGDRVQEVLTAIPNQVHDGNVNNVIKAVYDLMFLGAIEEAHRLLDQIEKDGHEHLALITRGDVYEMSLQYGDAARCYAEAVRLDGKDTQLRYRLAESLFNSKQPSEALAQYAIIKEHMPRDLNIRQRMLDCYRVLGNIQGQMLIMNELLSISHQYASDKKFQKRYRKLCVKAGKVSDHTNPYAQT